MDPTSVKSKSEQPKSEQPGSVQSKPVEPKVWRILGGLVLVVALLAGGVPAWGWLAHQSHSEKHDYWQSVQSITTVEVDSGSSEVRVEPGAPDRVTVRESMEWALRRPSVDLVLTGETLKVSVNCRSPLGVTGCGVSLDIQLPAATAVRAQGTSGSTHIRGLSGDVWARMSSGQIWLDGVSGPIWAQTKSGQVIATELASERVRVGAGSGRLSLGFARPPAAVTASATSGRVTVTVPTSQVRFRVEGSTDSGNRDIDPGVVDSASPRTIDVITTSGSVTVAAAPTTAGTNPDLAPSSLPTAPSPAPAGSAASAPA